MRSVKVRSGLGVCVAALLVSAACSSGGASPTDAAPATGAAPGGSGMAMGAAPECPATADVAEPPKRVITLDAAAAAFLIELGVGDRVVGTSPTSPTSPASNAWGRQRRTPIPSPSGAGRASDSPQVRRGGRLLDIIP